MLSGQRELDGVSIYSENPIPLYKLLVKPVDYLNTSFLIIQFRFIAVR